MATKRTGKRLSDFLCLMNDAAAAGTQAKKSQDRTPKITKGAAPTVRGGTPTKVVKSLPRPAPAAQGSHKRKAGPGPRHGQPTLRTAAQLLGNIDRDRALLREMGLDRVRTFCGLQGGPSAAERADVAERLRLGAAPDPSSKALATDVMIGLDVGSTSTKIIVRTPFDALMKQGQAVPAPE